MTTITIHLGEAQDGAAGKTGIASGGRNPTPTACLILYPSDCSVKLKDWISCVYSSTDTASSKKVDQLTKDFKIPTRGYSASAFNTWKLGDEAKPSMTRITMLIELTPEEAPQGGESFDAFKKRVLEEFKSLIKDIGDCPDTSLLVAPPMTIQMIYAYVESTKGKKKNTIDTAEFLEGEFTNICPYRITQTEDGFTCEDLNCDNSEDKESEEDEE